MPGPTNPLNEVPAECPRCGKLLYSTTHARPEPGLAPLGRALLLVGGLTSTAVYLGSTLLIRAIAYAHHLPAPTWLISLFLFVPALVPGIAIAWIAYRLPQIGRVRCWNCKWSARFPASARWAAARPVARASGVRAMSPSDRVVDDEGPWKECTAWAYAQIREGRTPEEVAAELVTAGWAEDDVAAMVEQCRRDARYQPSAVRAARAAGEGAIATDCLGAEAARRAALDRISRKWPWGR